MCDRSIFFFDFDNTLYSHQSRRIPPSALRALAWLREHGHIVALVSGRGNESLSMFRREFDVLPELICLLNGQIILRDGQQVFERHIPPLAIGALCARARSCGVICGGYDQDGLVISGIDDRVRTVWEDFHDQIPRVAPHFEKSAPVYQASLYITQDESTLFAELLDGYITNWSHPYLCNLISRQAGKAHSIRWCLERFGISRENAYAFGDGYNDMDMLPEVGHGVAMENGYGQLKRLAETVAPAPEEDGILLTLRGYGFAIPD